VALSSSGRNFLRLSLFSLLPAGILVKSANSLSGTLHGIKDRNVSCQELLLYLQSFRLSGAGRQNDYYGLILSTSKLYEELVYFVQPFPRVNWQEDVYILLNQDDVYSAIPCY
jgi:hypothetical protein